MAHQRLPDGVLAPAGADHRDERAWKKRLDRGRLRAVLALLHHPDGRLGGVDGELEHHDAVVKLGGDAVAGVAEGVQHGSVVGQHLGHEALDAALAARLGEVLEQHLADAAALVGVLDEEGDLGLARLDPVEAAHRDHPVAQQHHQRDPVGVVDLGEAATSRSGRLGIALKNRKYFDWSLHALVELHEELGVVGTDRAQVGRASVAQQDVGLPVARGARGLLRLLRFGRRHGPEASGSPGRPAACRPGRRRTDRG